MNFDFFRVFDYWDVLLHGLGITLFFTVTSAVIGTLLGFVVSLIRMAPNRALKWPARLYVEFFRGTPMLIQLFWIFFCLPLVIGQDIPPYLSVLLSMVLFMAAITSETFRGALKSISGEQYDACVALGLNFRVKSIYVVFPQALLRSVPPLLSNVVSLFKESALISSVGVADLMFVSSTISSSTARPVEFLSAAAVIYFAVAFPLTRLVDVFEKKMLSRYT
ncbi:MULTISPECIES: amino acid ABC transporter permease [unclassified Modicisalibacter]|uniref:amino acid ABC transporter permease n=1 Tax=unclassified Modicisalibacter TaxID=2679913 RepID=UPI001CCD5BE4|nr:MULTISPECIES: amino acid ABC transporter permease [unclassified Modicisalibacter]MBZ9557945.1 amino acid ABC transporter permease [Modicisalibacter sp. R2A 31.J]MBZ9573387.1 amino acid ABC transporter permease [Modicisalibacter sp. MOD 31.J]